MSERNIFTNAQISGGKLMGKYRRSWVEESFSPDNASSQPLPLTRSYLGMSIRQNRIRVFTFVIAAGILMIFCRVFYLQVIRGDHYRFLAEGNRIRLRAIPAERGIIYDRFSRELVQNVPSFLLSVIPQDLPRDKNQREAIIKRVAEAGGMAVDAINAILEKYQIFSYDSLVIKENLDYDTALKLYIQNADLPGVLIEKSTKRFYLAGEEETAARITSLSHLLGYLSKLDSEEVDRLQDKGYLFSDNIGKAGLEKFYETALRGRYGKKKIEVNALGKELNVLAEEPSLPGKNLILTIDWEAQQRLEKSIERVLERSGKKRAVGIAMNPQDGSILALVSLPSFDNNHFSGGIARERYEQYVNDADYPLFNRAIGGNYPSGSTIKPVVAAAALQEGIITPQTTIVSRGGVEVGKWFFRDWKKEGHGLTNVTKAIAWSVNTFFYYISGGYGDFVGLGAEQLIKYLRLFNLGQPTGVDLPGEQSGFVPDKKWKEAAKGERWYVGDTYNLSIGQGNLLVTPLQVAQWTAVVANGGKIVQPHLGDRLINPLDKREEVLSFKIFNRGFIAEEHLAVVKHGMRQCVTVGSCQLLGNLAFPAAGKTGTAQWSASKDNHAWFTCFAPYDEPRIVVTVLVEEGGEGSVAAMPIARDFLSWWGRKYLDKN